MFASTGYPVLSLFLVMTVSLIAFQIFFTPQFYLVSLLKLEVIMLTTLLLLGSSMTTNFSPLFILTFFTLAVAEASFGLGLLLRLARNSSSLTAL